QVHGRPAFWPQVSSDRWWQLFSRSNSQKNLAPTRPVPRIFVGLTFAPANRDLPARASPPLAPPDHFVTMLRVNARPRFGQPYQNRNREPLPEQSVSAHAPV